MTRHCLDLFKGKQVHTVADEGLRKVIESAKPEAQVAASTASAVAVVRAASFVSADSHDIDRNEHGFAKFDASSDEGPDEDGAGSDEGSTEDVTFCGVQNCYCPCAECKQTWNVSDDDEVQRRPIAPPPPPVPQPVQHAEPWGRFMPESSSRHDQQASDDESESSRCAAEIRHPSAAKGGQRVETRAVPKPSKKKKEASKGQEGRRKLKLCSAPKSLAAPTHHVRVCKKTNSAATTYQQPLSDELRGKHFIKVSRMGLKKGQYILGDRRQFVGSCSAHRTPFYKEVMDKLLKKLQEGTITTKTVAKKFVNDEVRLIKDAGHLDD